MLLPRVILLSYVNILCNVISFYDLIKCNLMMLSHVMICSVVISVHQLHAPLPLKDIATVHTQNILGVELTKKIGFSSFMKHLTSLSMHFGS